MKLRELWERNNRGFLIERVKGRFSYTKTGYRFDRYLIRAFLGGSLFFVLAVFIWGVSRGIDLNELYFKCPDGEVAGCVNPYYLNCNEEMCREIEFKEHFMAGESAGMVPDTFFNSLALWAMCLAILTFLGGLLLNHFRYNRGLSPFEIEFEDDEVVE